MRCNHPFPNPIAEPCTNPYRLTAAPHQHGDQRGFVLITTLIILSVLTLLTVALFSISINDTLQARNHTDTQRSKLAVDSGFEAAKALLLQLTRNDHYFVCAGIDEDPDTTLESPYHFVSIPHKSGTLIHMPLWAGGIVQQLIPGPPPTWHRNQSLPTADAVLAGLVEGSSNATRSRMAQQPVYTSWIEETLGPQQGSGKIRYTFWIEDLEGLPQIDVMGSAQVNAPQTLRLGYSRFDPRLPNFTSTGRFTTRPEFGTEFAIGLAIGEDTGPGQPLVDAIAPGLSPREIHLAAGPLDGLLAVQAGNMARSGGILTSSGAGSFDERLTGVVALGLQPYLRVPHVPFALGYRQVAGQAKTNLNALLSEGPAQLYEHLSRTLPERWQQRGGAFPGDYLATLAANIFDYADTDSFPTTFSVDDDPGPFPVRGTDSYPLVNECYYRFQWLDNIPNDQENPTHVTLRIGVTPFVEFWNPTNQPIAAQQLSLVYAENGKVLATGFRSEVGANQTPIDLSSLEHIVSHKPTKGALRLSQAFFMQQNSYVVVPFPTVIYEFADIPLQAGEQQPEEFTLVGKNGDYDIGTYKILWGERVIDWAPAGGYRSPAPFRWQATGTAPASRQRFRGGDAGHNYLKTDGAGKPKPSSRIINPGDPRMSYYFRNHLQEENDYANDSTLGARNVHTQSGKTKAGNEVDPELWPDGGYRTQTVAHPETEAKNPATGNSLAENYSDGAISNIGRTAVDGGSIYNARAPFRISNLGRFYTISELGNIYDPLMYASNQKPGDALQWRDIHATQTRTGNTSAAQGGGNTLRIGRPEHPALIDTPAAQLLDLFHAGINGTNLSLPPDVAYNAQTLFQPPSARNARIAGEHQSADVYGVHLHGESPFEAIRGRLNINTASVASIRMLLEGVLAVDAGYGDEIGKDGRHPVRSLASEIHQSRPFASLSQLARVFNEYPPLYRDGKTQNPDDEQAVNGPRFATSDAAHEETFARLINLGSLSSRHFRIHVAGDYLPTAQHQQPASEERIYEVFLRPIHNLETGELIEVRCDILNMRDR